MSGRIVLGGEALDLLPEGALWWERHRLLVVADLHFEKGSAYARRGRFLPPYDTLETLARLEALVERTGPAIVVSLGDGFHDRHGPASLDEPVRRRLGLLQRRREWLWIKGNHDPELPATLGGAVLDELRLDGLVFRHLPVGEQGEVAGHLHPKARVAARGASIARPCYAGDGRCLLLPAFGSFTGGLNVLDPAITGLFPGGFHAYLLGEARVFRIPHHQLLADRRLHAVAGLPR